MRYAKFTPGPWYAGRPVMTETDTPIVSIGLSEVAHKPSPCHYEDTICEVWQNPNLGEDAMDNAQLIRAAPELYESLKDLLPILAAVRLTTSLGKTQLARIERAKAALAYAQGDEDGH